MITTILIILSMIQHGEMGRIEVDHGTIKTIDYNTCNITGNGLNIVINGSSEIPGLWFGYVTYVCDDTAGTLISKLDCKTCGFYCTYNNLVNGCEQWLVPFIISTTLTILVSLLLIAMSHKLIFKLSGDLLVNIVKLHYRIKDTKVIRRLKMMKKHSNVSIRPHLTQTIRIIDPIRASQIDVLRNARLERELATTNPEYIELVETGGVEMNANFHTTREVGNVASVENSPNCQINIPYRHNYPDLDEIIKRQEDIMLKKVGKGKERSAPSAPMPRSRSPSPVLALATAALIMSSVIPENLGCDENLYMNSKGLVCKENECKELNTYFFHVQSGQSICFKDMEGEKFDIKIVETSMKSRFNLMYYTSEYSLKQDTYSNCKGVGECWQGGCKKNTVGSRFKDTQGAQEGVHGYTCGSDSVGCDSWCFHYASCVYVHWWIVQIGEKIPVYKIESKMWEVKIETNYKGLRTNYVFNANNPSVNLLDFVSGNSKKVPIIINSLESEELIIPNGLIIVDSTSLSIDVSDVNMPETDKIGDYQLALRGTTQTFNSHNVQCQINSCEAICVAPQSKIQRIKKMASNLKASGKAHEFQHIRTSEVAETKHLTRGSVSLTMGNVNFKNLQVVPGTCEIDLTMTFACSSCSYKPYAIFNSYNIKSEGTVLFTSNCTFDVNYMSCNKEPYKMQLIHNEKVCLIHIMSQNKTLIINFEYNFYGELDLEKTLYAMESTSELLKDVITSPGFIDGLTWTLTGFLAITSFTTITLRVVKAISTYKMHQVSESKINT
nr:MAG: glycoprotein [Beetle phasma-like virus]